MATMTNTARVDAVQSGADIFADSTIEIQLPAITVVKSTDKPVWTDSEATFTVVVRQIEEAATGVTVTDLEFSDTINPQYATLVRGTVTVNGTALTEAQYTFNETTGLLQFELPDLAPTETHTITFRVNKV